MCVCVCGCVWICVSYLCVNVCVCVWGGGVWCIVYVCVHLCAFVLCVSVGGGGGGGEVLYDGERDDVVYISAYCVCLYI